MPLEKRESSRNQTKTPVCHYLLTPPQDAELIDGILRNFSSEGVYMESSRLYPKGSVIVLRIIYYPHQHFSTGAKAAIRSISLAEVKWVHPLKRRFENCYGIGLRFLYCG